MAEPERINPKRIRGPNRIKAEVSVMALDALRQAGKPLTTADIADHIIDRAGLERAGRLVKLARTRAFIALRNHMLKGLVVASVDPNGDHVWEVAD